MPASGDRGGAVERCVVGSGRVAPEAGWDSSEPPHEASATESEITARTAPVTARRIVGARPGAVAGERPLDAAPLTPAARSGAPRSVLVSSQRRRMPAEERRTPWAARRTLMAWNMPPRACSAMEPASSAAAWCVGARTSSLVLAATRLGARRDEVRKFGIHPHAGRVARAGPRTAKTANGGIRARAPPQMSAAARP
jgi:hypothetical protein